MQASFAARVDIESHLNNNNHSGIQHHGDRDYDADGDIESDGHAIFKLAQYFDVMILKPIVIPERFIELLIVVNDHQVILLFPQDEPNPSLKPPISA